MRLTSHGRLFEPECEEGTRSRLEVDKDEQIINRARNTVTIELSLLLPLRGGRKFVTRSSLASPRPDGVPKGALRKAHAILLNERGFRVMQTAPVSPYDRNILRLAFLPPDIQQAIITGRQPPHLILETRRQMTIPLSWETQHVALVVREPDTGIAGAKTLQSGELEGPNRH